MNDNEINNLESYIPTLAMGAFDKAYLDVLTSGNSVLEVIGDAIYEVFPNGDKKKIKDVKTSLKVDMSKKIYLR